MVEKIVALLGPGITDECSQREPNGQGLEPEHRFPRGYEAMDEESSTGNLDIEGEDRRGTIRQPSDRRHSDLLDTERSLI